MILVWLPCGYYGSVAHFVSATLYRRCVMRFVPDVQSAPISAAGVGEPGGGIVILAATGHAEPEASTSRKTLSVISVRLDQLSE